MNVQRKKLGLAVALCLPLWAPFVAGAQSTDSVSEDGTAAEKRSQTKTLETITVIADRSDSFSSDYVQVGTFRDARVLDTPLTVSVVTKDLLQAQDARSIIDAVRNTPGVTQSQINANIYSNISIRGIPVDNLTNYRLNGVLPVINLIDMPMEDKDRIEILKGAGELVLRLRVAVGHRQHGDFPLSGQAADRGRTVGERARRLRCASGC